MAVVIGFIALLGGGIWAGLQQVATDEETLCPTSGPTALTVVLVDATDSFTPVQKAAVESKLEEVIAGLQEYEQIQVHAIDPGVDPLKPGFGVCRPKAPEDVNDWYENRNHARVRFEQEFRPRLRSVLAGAVERPSTDKSPIMEAIQGVVVGPFHKADAAAGRPLPKRLLIISDMMENGEGGSHYAGVPSFSAFKETAAYRRLRSHMDGIEVRVLYLGRPDADAVQGEPHTAFWQDYFFDQKATVKSILWVEG